MGCLLLARRRVWLLLILGTTLATSSCRERSSLGDQGATANEDLAVAERQQPEPRAQTPEVPVPQQPPQQPEEPDVVEIEPLKLNHDVFEEMPVEGDQLKVLCSRGGNTSVHRAFCSQEPPQITSLIELQQALGLAFTDRSLVGRGNNGQGGNPSYTLTAHSSSLVARFTNVLNPRVLLMTPINQNQVIPGFTIMGFVRGDQFAEIVAHDPQTEQLHFFLAVFKQDCNTRPGGCSPGQLLTPEIEKNWTSLTIYEDEDLDNTFLDCKHCHQPEGAGTAKLLRMQELRNPWTHFFRDNTDGDDLFQEFAAIHPVDDPNYSYGGIPGPAIRGSDPQKLERHVRGNNGDNQPNQFITDDIRDELAEDDTQCQNSPTWMALYRAAFAGQFINPPFCGLDPSDPVKKARFAAQLKNYYDTPSATTMAQIEDIRLIMDPQNLAYAGLAMPETAPGTDTPVNGQDILNMVCLQCHNSNLDYGTRARFQANLVNMGEAEILLAIERVEMGTKEFRQAHGITDPTECALEVMPPCQFFKKDDVDSSNFSDQQRRVLIDYLQLKADEAKAQGRL